MLKVDQYDFIRTNNRVYGKKVKEIARVTGHSKNTVKKALRGEHKGYKERENQPFPVLEPYLEIIDGWLESDKENPKKQRHTAVRVYNRLKMEHNFEGAETTVRRYVRQVKIRLGLNGQQAFIPCDPEAGIEAEVDWGRCRAIIGGQEALLKFICMRSKFSGKHFVRCYPCERQQALFDGHIQAFTFFGGIFPILKFHRNCTQFDQATMRNSASTKDFLGSFCFLLQTALKSSLNATLAMICLKSEKAKLLRPLTLCRRSGIFSSRVP